MIQLKDAHKPEYFGLEGLVVHPIENAAKGVVPAKDQPVKSHKFISLFYRRFKQVAVFIFVISFCILVQDFAYHYMEDRHEYHYSHQMLPVEQPDFTVNDDQDLAILDDSFFTEPETTLLEQPAPEEPIAEEEPVEQLTDNSTSNQTHSQPIVETNIERPAANDSSYYIIVGTFKHEANADRLSYGLMKKGIETNIITSDNVSRVSVAKFFNRKNAEEKLGAYKGFDKNVWVYARAK